MSPRTVAQVIVDELARAGIGHVFLVPGGAATYLVDAVAADERVSGVPMLHEGGAGVAAESYGQYSGHPGVAIVTSGPGSTNILTAVAAAFTDSTPMIVLAGQVKTEDLDARPRGRQFGFQHLPMAQVVEPITNACLTIRRPEDAAALVRSALALATTKRPGPVWIEVPLDVQSAVVPDSPSDAALGRRESDANGDSGVAFGSAVVAALEHAERPAVLVGNGVRASRALQAARDMVAALGIPTLVTWKMIDFLDESDPLLAGRPGGLAPWSSNLVQQECDLLLVLGARLDHAQVGYRLENLAPHAEVFRVEVDDEEAGKWTSDRVTTWVGPASDAIQAITAAARAVTMPSWDDWRAHVSALRASYGVPQLGLDHDPALSVYEVSAVLGRTLPGDAIVVSGSSGQGIEIFLQAFPVRLGQRVYCSAALGSMGFGLAGAIGAHAASGGQPVWCVEGDGSLAMSLHDFAAAGVRRLPVRLVFLDNGGYMSIKLSQTRLTKHHLGFDATSSLPLPPWDELAAALGWSVIDVATAEDLSEAVARAADADFPTMIHVHLRHGEIAYPRVTTKTGDDGRLVTSALDDMWPGLEESLGPP